MPGPWTGLLLAIVVVLLLVYLGVGAVAANALSTPKRQLSAELSPQRYGLAVEDVHLLSRVDRVPLTGWYMPRADSDRALVLVHGRDASRTEEFGRTFVDLAAALQRVGYNVFMVDLRGHGQSGDARYSFGLNERRDVIAVVDWLSNKGFRSGQIGVLGVSLGAASVVGATREDPRIGALVTDSAFADFCPVLRGAWKNQTGLPDLILPSVLFMNRVMYGYDLCASKPVDEIGKIAPRPILLIHSTDDQLVPVSNVRALQAAAPSAQVWVVSGPEHARIFNVDPATYTRRVIGFFDASLSSQLEGVTAAPGLRD